MRSPATTAPHALPVRRRRRRLRLPLAAATLAVLTVLAAATVSEAIAARSDAERYPAPGRIVSLPAGDMHLDCSGPGSGTAGPTVVLESGLGEPGVGFAPLQEELSKQLRVCSYDRPGYGWSERRNRDWSAEVAADELDKLLEAAGETAPRLLVAHSIGGFVARSYALNHPEDVAGLVLLDPTDTTFAQKSAMTGVAVAQSRVARTLTRLGVFRAAGESLVPSLVGAEPPAQLMERLPAAYPASSFSASIEELHGSAHSAQALEHSAGAERDLFGRGMPITILSSAEANAETLAAHRELAKLSPNGKQQQVPTGGHYVHYEHPDLVVQAVLDMVQQG